MLTTSEISQEGTAYTGATFKPWRTRAAPPPPAWSATARPAPYSSHMARNVPTIRATPKSKDAEPEASSPTPGVSLGTRTDAWADTETRWNHPK